MKRLIETALGIVVWVVLIQHAIAAIIAPAVAWHFIVKYW